jgi:hypothetical protein
MASGGSDMMQRQTERDHARDRVKENAVYTYLKTRLDLQRARAEGRRGLDDGEVTGQKEGKKDKCY